jgi:hypothetical protein
MIYRLISKTFPPDGPAELVFAQKINTFDESFPVQIRVEAFVCPPYFREAEVLIADYEIEFESKEIKSIDGQPLDEIFDSAKEVRIVFNFARATENEPILLPASDDILEAEFIE